MSKFAMFAKVTAKSGKGAELREILLEASQLPMRGCEMYIVNTAASDPDSVFVYELWDKESDHDDSLKLENVKAVVAKAKPIVQSFEGTRLSVAGGRGVTRG